MPSIHSRPTSRSALLLLALSVALAALVFVVATKPAGAAGQAHSPKSGEHYGGERLVVRGDATVTDAPCPEGVCPIELTDGHLRGTPVAPGAYGGSLKLKVADAFSNGEGGVCAPIAGRIVLGAGSPDRLLLAVSGVSCQDGAGPVTAAAFTGLARFTVRRGTGRYAGSTGDGLAVFSEDASDHDHMTLIGRLRR